jgi:hypothetical protein
MIIIAVKNTPIPKLIPALYTRRKNKDSAASI